jgi:DNA-binding beta-propeller fold protein YncE
MRRLMALGWLVIALLQPGSDAAAQSNEYVGTIGATGVQGSDNGHLNLPEHLAVDAKNGHLLIADSANDRVQVYDSATAAYVATIGQTDNPGSGNDNFQLPVAVAIDAARNHILVVDRNGVRVQIFDATSFAYVATLGGTGGNSGAGTDFKFPVGIAIDPSHGRILLADTGNNRIQVFDAGTLGYVATLGDPGGLGGNDNAHFNAPDGVAYDTTRNQILVADTGNSRIQIYDGNSFAYLSTIGVVLLNPLADDNHLNQPFDLAYDSGRDQILVADTGNERVQAFSAASHAYAGTIGTTDVAGTDNAHFDGPAGIAVTGPGGTIVVSDFGNDRVQIFSQAVPSVLAAALLPGARSVQQIGSSGLATVYATMLNSGATALGNCRIGLTDPVFNGSTPIPLTLTYQTTDPATNALTGSPNTPASIGANSAQSFLVSFLSPTAAEFLQQTLSYSCDGTPAAAIEYGVNTADLLFSSAPVPDIIALAATSSQNGVLTVPFSSGGAAAFAVATINAGSAGALTVTRDAGDATALPVSVAMCQTNPANGQCLSAPATTVPVTIAAGATGTFSVFVSASAAIPFDPAGSRIFIRFLDGNNIEHGASSVAVTTE